MQIVAALREQSKRLWPSIAFLWATLIIGVASDPTTLLGDPTLLGAAAWLLRPIACWILVVRVMWRTPIRSAPLFLALTINLPLLAAHMLKLTILGLSVPEWISALLIRQVSFTCFFILPAAALALITRSRVRLILGLMAPAAILGIAAIRGRRPAEGIPWLVTMIIVIAAFLACLVVRRYGRREWLSWAIVCLATGLSYATLRPDVWRFYVLDSWVSQERISPNAVRISFDPSRGGPESERFRGAIVLPVRIDAIPRDLDFEEYRSSVTIEGPNGTWHSGWDRHAWVFVNLTRKAPWLVTDVDEVFYQTNKAIPVRLSVEAIFILTRSTPLITRSRNGVDEIPGFGQCSARHINGADDAFRCYSPAYHSHATGDTIDRLSLAIPVTPSFDPIYSSQLFYGWPRKGGEIVHLRTTAAYTRRTFEIPNLKMSDYHVDTLPGPTDSGISF